MAGKTRGRARLYSEELKGEFFEAISAGLTEQDACLACGFSHDTLAAWKRGTQGAPEDFNDQLKQVKARRVMSWFNIVRRKAAGRKDKDGNWIVEPHLGAALELIDRLAGPDYRKASHTEVTVFPNQPQRSGADLLATLKVERLTPKEQFVLAELLDKMSGIDEKLPGNVLEAEVQDRSNGHHPPDD